MAYKKQTFSDGEVLTAAKINHMEDGIEAAHNANPPSCNFPAYSKVLSNGISGPEWVDMPTSGEDGAPGKDGADGKDGAPGKTPEMGVDYFTEEDKAEMVNAVLAALPNGDEVAY